MCALYLWRFIRMDLNVYRGKLAQHSHMRGQVGSNFLAQTVNQILF